MLIEDAERIFQSDIIFPVFWMSSSSPPSCTEREVHTSYQRLFIIVQPQVLGYGQSVGTIVEASDWPEDQEHAAPAVGGQEALHGVNF